MDFREPVRKLRAAAKERKEGRRQHYSLHRWPVSKGTKMPVSFHRKGRNVSQRHVWFNDVSLNLSPEDTCTLRQDAQP